MPEDAAACRRRAMDLLARREHSRLELERKLAARSFKESLVADVLDDLEREGLLSDDRFAQSFVEARYARGQGPNRIRRELTARGIEPDAASLDDERFDWNTKVREARIKRFGPALPTSLRDKARQTRFLEYRGFSHDQIRRALEFDDD